MMNSETEFLILGAGVTGLAAGVELKEAAVILESEETPGGLVRSKCFDNDYWYDNVLHLLHFKDEEIQKRIGEMIGPDMKPCPPEAWIECKKDGNVLYPFQLNLGGLRDEVRNRCITDYAKAYYHKNGTTVHSNYAEFLQATFGEGMCDLFYFPYNQKLYKYPLEKISVDELTWNLHRPSFEEILRGGFAPNIPRPTYNTNAFYPSPPKGAPLRGMEVLSQALVKEVSNLELNCRVTSIDPKDKTVWADKNGEKRKYTYTSECLSTIPLPHLINMCSGIPGSLVEEVNKLEYTKVYSIAISIRGSRPEKTGHWRYYTDPAIPFTRLIFMNEFDEHCSPEDGWALLAEVTWPGKAEPPDEQALIKEVTDSIKEVGLLADDCTIIGTHVWVINHAYVIFTSETQRIINNCFEFLKQFNITSLGRYGKWEYSSMYQNIKDGFTWGKKFNTKNLLR